MKWNKLKEDEKMGMIVMSVFTLIILATFITAVYGEGFISGKDQARAEYLSRIQPGFENAYCIIEF